MVGFADHFLGVSQRLSDFEQQLEAMSPWMADMFSSGQPVFEDEAFEPVFIDNEGSLSAHCELVPAPRLELGTGSDNICALRCVLSAALEELERGQTRHAKAILNTLKEVLS
jgi:hypothetical protein